MRRPRAVRHPEMPSLATIDEGGVTSALGFTASGVHAGFYEGNDRLDCALGSADVPCPCGRCSRATRSAPRLWTCRGTIFAASRSDSCVPC